MNTVLFPSGSSVVLPVEMELEVEKVEPGEVELTENELGEEAVDRKEGEETVELLDEGELEGEEDEGVDAELKEEKDGVEAELDPVVIVLMGPWALMKVATQRVRQTGRNMPNNLESEMFAVLHTYLEMESANCLLSGRPQSHVLL